MSAVEKLLKNSGKENFEVDKGISTAYIMGLCWKSR